MMLNATTNQGDRKMTNWLKTSDESVRMEMPNYAKVGRDGHVIKTDGTVAIQTVASNLINTDGSARSDSYTLDEYGHMEVIKDPKEARQFTLYRRPLTVLFQRRGRPARVHRGYAFKAVDPVTGVTSKWTTRRFAINTVEVQKGS